MAELSFSRYNEIKEQMDKYVHTVTEDPNLTNPAPAFALVRNGLIGEIYKIFVNSSMKDVEEFLYMHECGHIIFDHVNNADKKALGVSSRIRARYEQYKEWFNNEDEFFDYFKGYLFNVVEDFEVNSKFFTKDEFEAAQPKLAELLNAPEARGMWPEDYGYPVGKTWREYLTYILENMEPFLKKTKENMSNNSSSSSSSSSSSKSGKESKNKSGKSSSESSSKKNKKNGGGESESEGKSSKKSEKNGKQSSSSSEKKDGEEKKGFSKEQLEEMKKVAESKDKKKLEEKAEEITAKASGMEHEEFYRGDYGGPGCDDESAGSKIEGYVTFEDLKKILDKEVFNKVNVSTRRDQMYNVNRRKLGTSSIIIPRNLNRQEFRPDNFYVLLDVSGSISTTFSKKVVEFFNHFSKLYGKDSRLIMWDDYLRGDEKLSEITKVVYGGNNDLASGIDYIEANYIKGNADAKVFIISDFYDDLNKMAASIKRGKANYFAINWHGDETFLEHGYPKWKKTYKRVWNLDYETSYDN